VNIINNKKTIFLAGGDFDYAFGRDPAFKWSAALIFPAVAIGVTGGALSTAFVLSVRCVKAAAAAFTGSSGGGGWRRVVVGTCAGLVVGLIGVLWPYTLLWGETRVRGLLLLRSCDGAVDPALTAWAVAGACPPLADLMPTHSMEGASLTGDGAVDLSAESSAHIGIMKLVAIAVAVGAGLATQLSLSTPKLINIVSFQLQVFLLLPCSSPKTSNFSSFLFVVIVSDLSHRDLWSLSSLFFSLSHFEWPPIIKNNPPPVPP